MPGSLYSLKSKSLSSPLSQRFKLYSLSEFFITGELLCRRPQVPGPVSRSVTGQSLCHRPTAHRRLRLRLCLWFLSPSLAPDLVSISFMDTDAARTARESLELVFQMSSILETGLDRHTLSVLIALCDLGLNPEALLQSLRSTGCDASILIASSGSNRAEMDHKDNRKYSMSGRIVIQAKAAVDAVASCRNKVSCADILAMAARDVVGLAGGPWYPVELGRLDGLSSTAASVDGKLPKPNMNLDQLNAIFAANGLTQTDMIALSGKKFLQKKELLKE